MLLAMRSEVNKKDAHLPAISRATTASVDSPEGRLANPVGKSRDISISVEEWHERIVAALNDQSRTLPRVW